ncbi:hypothetical protein [Tropicimonas isoalkanivorans]|uniref:Cupin domain-containing protein n=1 Tax=Tropicimonas isoalkanivorans TaxID=441112 RepID=A0A1I1GGF1_9RHOB|nr:hypothetical protein [Tropicimonas isoalkanivorans]SFC10867.1 hypothetical protein SAMN04488094_102571 [Tropicimonas isoalkanivorans]
MQFLHLTEDNDGISHFSEVPIQMAATDFAPPAPSMPVSPSEPATALLYLVLPAGWSGEKHPSPRRQVAFCLAGQLRVEAGDGETREIGPGGIWRMEDTDGAGHTTSVIGPENVQLAIVQL